MLDDLIRRISEWRRKRKWPAEAQLLRMRSVVQEDQRWMAHNPIVMAITQRYLPLLADDWESKPLEDVSNFRERIGLSPHVKPKSSDDSLAPCAGKTMCVRPFYFASQEKTKQKEKTTTNVEKHLDLLGMRVQDKVTGFSGVVSSISFDLYGCIQAIVNPGIDNDGKMQEQHWFDVSRVKLTSSDPVIERPNYAHGYQAEGRQGAAEKPNSQKV